MSLTEDQVNHIINDQEDAIAELKSKLLEMTDSRDLAIGRSLDMVMSFRRIECAKDIDQAWDIARKAIDDFLGK